MGFKKLIVDIFMGAIVPVMVLKFVTEDRTGIKPEYAYLIAALIPVTYILCDTFFYSKRFNAITTYVALAAIMQGAVAFWFVDGLKYAIKDSAGSAVAVVMFAGSLVIGRPLFRAFVVQGLMPANPGEEAALRRLMDAPPVYRMLVIGTLIMIAETILAGSINFALNLTRVTAEFRTPEFNNQKAAVDAITRIIFPVLSIAAFMLAFKLVLDAVYKLLPEVRRADRAPASIYEQIEAWEKTLARPMSAGAIKAMADVSEAAAEGAVGQK